MDATTARKKGSEALDNVYFTLELDNRFVVVGTVKNMLHTVSFFKDGKREPKVMTLNEDCRVMGAWKRKKLFLIRDDKRPTSQIWCRSMDEAFISHAIDEKKTGDYKKKPRYKNWFTYIAQNETMYTKRTFSNVVTIGDLEVRQVPKAKMLIV